MASSNFLKAIVGLTSVLLFTSTCLAESISKPHEFSAGGAANAAEVNANFDTVYGQVNKLGGQITIDAVNGRVGIGAASPGAKLDVSGGIKIGNETSSCVAATEGTLRYNSAAREMEYCSGTAWKSLEQKTPIIWSGGCTTFGATASAWNKYCADGVDINTAMNHIQVNPNGTVTFLQGGYFRVNFRTVSSSQQGVITLRFLKNGLSIAEGYVGNANNWATLSLDQSLPFNAGDALEVQVYLPSAGNAYYLWDAQGRSRLQISYEGALN